MTFMVENETLVTYCGLCCLDCPSLFLLVFATYSSLSVLATLHLFGYSSLTVRQRPSQRGLAYGSTEDFVGGRSLRFVAATVVMPASAPRQSMPPARMPGRPKWVMALELVHK